MNISVRPALVALLAFSALLPARGQAARDIGAIYRNEMASADTDMRWKGTPLAGEARLAAVAGGISWRPAWEGQPLFRQEKAGPVYGDAAARGAAFAAARGARNERMAIPYALSVVLDPPAGDMGAWRAAFDYLSEYDADFDRLLLGVLQAPEKLPAFASHQYAAMDVLVCRASVRTMPLFMSLSDASDRYIRSRAIAGLGIVGYRRRAGQAPDLPVRLRENSISQVQQRLIDEAVRRAAEDKNYHVRAAAALALGLEGDDTDLPILEKLLKDPAYLVLPGSTKETRQLRFPVREEAARAMRAFGREPAVVAGGTFSGKALKQVTRGAKDVTNDHGDIRPNQQSRVSFGNGAW